MQDIVEKVDTFKKYRRNSRHLKEYIEEMVDILRSAQFEQIMKVDI